LAPAKICLTISDKAIGHSRRWRRKEREMFSLLATLVALVCFTASVAMIYTDGADYLYPPRFE
jgi:hypothetical protein